MKLLQESHGFEKQDSTNEKLSISQQSMSRMTFKLCNLSTSPPAKTEL